MLKYPLILLVAGAAVISLTPGPGWSKQHTDPVMGRSVHFQSLHELKDRYGQNKMLPPGYERQALVALSYFPDLAKVRVEFRFTTSGPPLQARPTVWSTLTRSALKRTYLINIALRSNPIFEPILLGNMPFDAQVGVLGHELAHIQQFSKKSFWGMVGVLFGNLSAKYMDRMEYATDDLAVRQGLGHQLLAWSTHCNRVFNEFVEAQKGNVPGFLKGAMQNERYMKPETIRARMCELEIYRQKEIPGMLQD